MDKSTEKVQFGKVLPPKICLQNLCPNKIPPKKQRPRPSNRVLLKKLSMKNYTYQVKPGKVI